MLTNYPVAVSLSILAGLFSSIRTMSYFGKTISSSHDIGCVVLRYWVRSTPKSLSCVMYSSCSLFLSDWIARECNSNHTERKERHKSQVYQKTYLVSSQPNKWAPLHKRLCIYFLTCWIMKNILQNFIAALSDEEGAHCCTESQKRLHCLLLKYCMYNIWNDGTK